MTPSFQERALQMARTQARYLLDRAAQLRRETGLRQAATLVHDSVRHLADPALGVAFALAFHPTVSLWGAWSSWAAALDELLAVADTHATAIERIQLLNCRSQAARELDDLRTAYELATTALRLAETEQAAWLMAAALRLLGLVALSQDELRTAESYLERAYTLGVAQLPALELGHISMDRGNLAVQQAAFSAAEAHFRQALAHYMAAEDEFHIAKVQCNIAVLPSEQQKLGDVPAALLEARSVFQRLEARYDYGLAENDVGYTYLHLGRFAEAETAFQAALQTFRQIGSLNKYALALSNLAELYVTSADWSRAVPTLTEARELALVCERPLLVAAVDVDRGRMLLAQGDEAGASAAWQAALAVQRAKGAWSAARYTEQLLDSLATGAQSLDHQA